MSFYYMLASRQCSKHRGVGGGGSRGETKPDRYLCSQAPTIVVHGAGMVKGKERKIDNNCVNK